MIVDDYMTKKCIVMLRINNGEVKVVTYTRNYIPMNINFNPYLSHRLMAKSLITTIQVNLGNPRWQPRNGCDAGRLTVKILGTKVQI